MVIALLQLLWNHQNLNLVEVKSPFNHQDNTIEEACKDKTNYGFRKRKIKTKAKSCILIPVI